MDFNLGPRPEGHHYDPYKKRWVPNLTEEQVMSMWPNSTEPKVSSKVLSTKDQWRKEDAELARSLLHPKPYPMEAAVFDREGNLTDLPEPRRMIGPKDNSLPPGTTYRIEEEAFVNAEVAKVLQGAHVSDGGSSNYYAIPANAKDLQDLIEFKRMEFGLANIFKAVYRFGEKSGTDKRYDMNKIIWFAQRELKRLDVQEGRAT